jgi:hypothetical protein
MVSRKIAFGGLNVPDIYAYSTSVKFQMIVTFPNKVKLLVLQECTISIIFCFFSSKFNFMRSSIFPFVGKVTHKTLILSKVILIPGEKL